MTGSLISENLLTLDLRFDPVRCIDELLHGWPDLLMHIYLPMFADLLFHAGMNAASHIP